MSKRRSKKSRKRKKRIFPTLPPHVRVRLKLIRGNGNCLFSSVAHQLQILGRQYSPGELRKMVVRALLQNHQMRVGVDHETEVFDGLTREQYADYISTPGMWGSLTDLRVLAVLLDVYIVVITKWGNEEVYFIVDCEGNYILYHHYSLFKI